MNFFILAILVFIVLGFRRGWKREVISLVSVLLACFLVKPETSDGISNFLSQIPIAFAVLTHSQVPAQPTSPGFFSGPWWSLAIFAGLIVLGYIIGDKVMPGAAGPHEQFIGIIPAVVSGAFIFWYLSNYNPKPVLDLSNGPGNDLPLIFVILILALVVALIAARVKKAPAGKK